MITIPQYDSMFSIFIYGVLIVPVAVLALCGRKSKILNLAVSLVMIFLMFGLWTLQMWEFLAFMAGEFIVVYAYHFIRRHTQNKFLYVIAFIASMLPILLVRTAAHTHYASYIGFIGMSYICFKVWQLLMDMYDGKIEKLPLIDMLGFLLFAPSFSSGPISRYQSFCDEYAKSIDASSYINDYLAVGIKKIVLGIFYKFAVAFFINTYIMSHITQVTVAGCVEYMYTYTLYLFFDFAGYSLIAIGTGCLMGVRLPDNFNKPFLARNMKEFWDRWHMSLSTWFNDYVFSRFVLNNMRNGLFKNPHHAARWAYMFTMMTMGLWHGFYLHYILYGAYEGFTLVLTDIWVKSKTYRKVRKMKYYNLISRVICFQLISFGMLLFSGFWISN